MNEVLLRCAVTRYRWQSWYLVVYLNTEVSTRGHHWARLRAAGWAAEVGGAESQRVCQGSPWWQNGVWTKRHLVRTADNGRPMSQVSESLRANSSTTRCKFYHPKRRSETVIS